MSAEFWEWLLSVVGSAGIIGIVAYVARGTVAKYFSKAIESRFEKQLEAFKADIRDNEKELDQIRSFLVSAWRERDSAIQSKKFEAAETLLRARQALSQLSMLVEYMKILNGEEILKGGDDPKIVEFIDALLKPLNVDEKLKIIGDIDKTIPHLYLSDRSLKLFEAYQTIIMHAAMMLKIYRIPLRDKGSLIKVGNLQKIVSEIIPNSKEGFDKWGDGFAYYWSSYFYDETLLSLRNEISGADDVSRDAKYIQRIALDSRQAQLNIRASLQKAGLTDKFIKSTEGDDFVSVEVYKN